MAESGAISIKADSGAISIKGRSKSCLLALKYII